MSKLAQAEGWRRLERQFGGNRNAPAGPESPLGDPQYRRQLPALVLAGPVQAGESGGPFRIASFQRDYILYPHDGVLDQTVEVVVGRKRVLVGLVVFELS